MKKNRSQFEVVVEVKDGILWGIVEGKGNFIPTPYGKTVDELKQNFKQLVVDYQTHEGKKDKFWKNVDAEKMEIEIYYDLQAFFKEFNQIKITSLAKNANMNTSLLRQYATGSKFPSAEQVKKIEKTIHQLGNRLQKINLAI